MRTLNVLAAVFAVVLVAAYVFDFVQHGPAAAFHLFFLLALSAQGAGMQFGVDLNRQNELANRDYYKRTGVAPEEIERRLAEHRALMTTGMVGFVALFEVVAATGLARWLDPMHNPWPILVALSLFAALFLGTMIWGVGYAIWKLRHG